jgi:hypothetical protein
MNNNLYLKHIIGAGFFAQLKFIIQEIYLNQFQKNKIIIDFSQEYFPYKDNNNNTCEFHNILTIKENISYEKNLIIYNDSNPSILFQNVFNFDQSLVKNEPGFAPIIYFRLLNNIQKQNYLKKLNRIIEKSIEINKNILESVENFYKKYDKYYILGIHYRVSGIHNCENQGTREVNFHLQIEKIFEKINNIRISKNISIDNFKIYLATDVKSIQNKFIKKYGTQLIYNKRNKYMMEKPNSVYEPHFGFALNKNTIKDKKFMNIFHKNKPGLEGGIQLLIDCLMLSKCNFFIPSMSNLSDFVLMFNPEIEYSYF